MSVMRLVMLVLITACASRQGPQHAAEKNNSAPPPPAEREAAPEATPQANAAHGLVHGGETFNVNGATVRVLQVTYVNQPCPKDAQCVHSGVVKSVQFRVERAGEGEEAVVAAGTERVVRQVLVRVVDVVEGPQATVELQGAVMPQRAPLRAAP